MTNDAFVGGDEHRTAAFEIGVGDYSLGWNLYTTSPDPKEYDSRPQKGNNADWESTIWKKHKHGAGTYGGMERVYSGFYIGVKTAKGNYRIGHDGAWSQDLFQNGIHRTKLINSPYVNTNLGSPNNAFSQFYRNQNPWSLYSH